MTMCTMQPAMCGAALTDICTIGLKVFINANACWSYLFDGNAAEHCRMQAFLI